MWRSIPTFFLLFPSSFLLLSFFFNIPSPTFPRLFHIAVLDSLYSDVSLDVCACDRQLKRCLAEDVVKEIMGDAHVIEELEKEWEQLQEDRQALRQVFPTGDSKVGA